MSFAPAFAVSLTGTLSKFINMSGRITTLVLSLFSGMCGQDSPTEPLSCAGCGYADVKGRLELHHRSYDGVREDARGTWIAAERHEDPLSMHPSCHELLHRLIDRDKVLSKHRSRPEATRVGLERLRTALKGIR